MNDTNKFKAMDALFATIPTFKCIEGCSACCGPLLMTRLEAKRIHRVTGIDPLALVVNLEEAMAKGCITCPFVHPETHLCTIYEIRPAVCRVFGSSEHPRLTCPHGCRPQTLLTKEQTNAIMNQVDKLGY